MLSHKSVRKTSSLIPWLLHIMNAFRHLSLETLLTLMNLYGLLLIKIEMIVI